MPRAGGRTGEFAIEYELVRVPGDRRLYELGNLGTLRRRGLLMRGASAEAGGRSWRFARRGLLGRTLRATDEGGAAVGSFTPRAIRRGGALDWQQRRYEIRPDSSWRERYLLAEGERPLALL
jgi:hypothetical protein